MVVFEVGLSTQPGGMNVFIINSFDKSLSLKESFRGVVPFIMSDFARVILLVLFPPITLALVHLLS